MHQQSPTQMTLSPSMTRVLRIALPVALLGTFALWMVLTPSGRKAGRAIGSGGASVLGRPLASPLSRGVGALVDKGTQGELEKAVRGQLAAFNRRDFAAALRFAAVGFQDVYSPAEFEEMVVRSFPQVAASQKATFQPARRQGQQQASVDVELVGRDGKTVRYIYTLARELGEWRVLSVTPQEQQQTPQEPQQRRQTPPPKKTSPAPRPQERARVV